MASAMRLIILFAIYDSSLMLFVTCFSICPCQNWVVLSQTCYLVAKWIQWKQKVYPPHIQQCATQYAGCSVIKQGNPTEANCNDKGNKGPLYEVKHREQSIRMNTAGSSRISAPQHFTSSLIIIPAPVPGCWRGTTFDLFWVEHGQGPNTGEHGDVIPKTLTTVVRLLAPATFWARQVYSPPFCSRTRSMCRLPSRRTVT